MANRIFDQVLSNSKQFQVDSLREIRWNRRSPHGWRSRIRTQVRDWLHYGEELGLGPFYRDRRRDELIAASNSELALEISTEADQTTEMASSQNSAPTESAAALHFAGPCGFAVFERERIEGDTLPLIRDAIGDCTRCKLHKGRTKIVFGVGNPKARADVRRRRAGPRRRFEGEPFVGRAGKLLTQMIEAMGLSAKTFTSPTW